MAESSSGAAARPWRVWVTPALLFVVALLVRLPHFATIPAPTDETDELLGALAIVRDGARPLVTSEPYLAPYVMYAMALAFKLFGPSFALGRGVHLVLGALAAPATWALGRALGGRRAALVAGLAMAVAFGPVILSSHVAWSHGSAATFLALGLAALLVAESADTRRRPAAFLAGLTLGLAMATHPTLMAFFPGVACWWILTNRTRLWQRLDEAVWIGLGMGLAYLPAVIYLLRHGLAPFRAAAEQREYVGAGPTDWPVGVVAWLGSLARNLAGPAISRPADPLPWLVGGLMVIGLAYAVRTGRGLPIAVVTSGALLMPLLIQAYKLTSLTGLRYAAPALPAAAAALGLLVEPLQRSPRRMTQVTGAALGILLVAVPLAAILSFYHVTATTGVTGAPVVEIVDALEAGGEARDLLFLDEHFDIKLVGGGDVGRAIGAMLTLRGVPFMPARGDKLRWYLQNGNGATYDLVLSGDTAAELSAGFALEPVRVVPVVAGQISGSGDAWGWYRFTTARGR
jgi:hypothetical protein